MKKAKVFITDIMKRYADAIDSICIAAGKLTEAVCGEILKYGKYVLLGLVVVLAYFMLAATMPVWYLPYKYFTREG